MADESKQQSANSWPTVKFSFAVKIDNTEASFQEISGLNAETQQIEYRGGNSKQFSTVKMPGIQKVSNVTMKKGLFTDDKSFWKLYEEIKMNTAQRKAVTISLLDEANNVAMTWTLTNAFPSKITTLDLEGDGNEVAIESLEITHEGLVLAQ